MSEPQVTSGAELRRKNRPYVTVPETGNTYQVRRQTLTAMIRSGYLPENLLAASIEETARRAGKKESDNSKPLTDDDLMKMEASQRATLAAVMFNPRLVEHAEADDEVEFEDMPPEDREYLVRWAKREVREQEISTIEGSVTVEAVETFPDNRRESSGTGDGGEVERDRHLKAHGDNGHDGGTCSGHDDQLAAAAV